MITKLHYLETANTNPFANLALEEHLLQTAQPGVCLLYLWQNHQTVVIGRNQNCWRECRVEALERDGGFLARRKSGGGAVYHDLGNLNFTFIAADGDYDVERQLRVLIQALQMLGLQAEASGRNDICIAGRKISGNAFQHERGFSCHHGTILVASDLSLLSRYLQVDPAKIQSKGVTSIRSRVANLVDFQPELTVAQVKAALKQSFGAVYGLPVNELAYSSLNTFDIQRRTEEFGSWEWRFGQAIDFSQKFYRRFSWGDLELQLQVQAGKVSQVAVFSDAVRTHLIELLPQALTGRNFVAAELARAVVTVAQAEAETIDMAADIRKMLLEDFLLLEQ